VEVGMKAVVLKEYGDADKLELDEVPEPRPGPGEVLVRIAAASINPIDWKLRSGALRAFRPLPFPAILGRDASGEVVEVGPGVQGFAPGNRVLGLVQHAHAERVVAPAAAWAHVPAGLDLIDAAALPLVALTGVQLLEEAVDPRRDQLVLVTGAVGGVGRAAVYAARLRGVRVLAGVRARQKGEAVALGTSGVVALDDEHELAGLPALDALADTVGGQTTARLLAKLKPGGVVGSVVGEPPGAKERGLTVRAIFTHPDSKRLGELAEAVARGELKIPVGARFPLAQVREAYRLAEGGGMGKVLLVT
jgi:NADPH:quinone reductase-like Zn-dependent oxidoreductase